MGSKTPDWRWDVPVCISPMMLEASQNLVDTDLCQLCLLLKVPRLLLTATSLFQLNDTAITENRHYETKVMCKHKPISKCRKDFRLISAIWS